MSAPPAIKFLGRRFTGCPPALSMSLKFTRVHAFTADRFAGELVESSMLICSNVCSRAGNPAAVFEGDLPSVETRQKLATEASVPNTAFITAGETPGVYTIDYYSQTARILLCGHASLAAARVLFDTHCKSLSKVQFKTAMAGDVVGTKEEDGRISIDFPASAEGALDSLLETDYGTKVLAAVLDSELSIKAADVLSIIKSVRGPVVELSSEVDLKSLRPDVSGFVRAFFLGHLNCSLFIFTAARHLGSNGHLHPGGARRSRFKHPLSSVLPRPWIR